MGIWMKSYADEGIGQNKAGKSLPLGLQLCLV